MPPSSTTTSPGSTPSPSDVDENLIVTEPGWLPTTERTPDQPLETIPAEGPSDGWDGESVDELEPPSEPTTSRTGTGQSSLASSDIPGLAEIARTLVGLASMLVRTLRTARNPELPPHVWIADEDDMAAMGDPLARIAARHTPVGKGPTGDMVDGLGVLVGATNYALKGVAGEADAALADTIPADQGAGL